MSVAHPAPFPVRLLASSALILVSGGYALWQPGSATRPVLRKTAAAAPVKKPTHVILATPAPAAPAATKIARTEPRAPVPATQDAAAEQNAPALPYKPLYADGDFTGEPFESDFGPLQIEVTIKDGRMVTLNFLQVPDHRERSAEISAEVIPILTQEAIQAQSPRIDIVASATYTTAAFADALYNALSKAQKN